MATVPTVDPGATQETIDIIQETVKGFSWQNTAVLIGLIVPLWLPSVSF